MTDSKKLKLIIDTDPGVDDILGILLALSYENVDLKLISLCFGNCDTVNSLRNIVSLFHVLKLEDEHRFERGKNLPFTSQRPKIAVGLETALDGSMNNAHEVHGYDGLGNVHQLAAQYTASKEWIDLFTQERNISQEENLPFIPSNKPAYLEILDILKENEPDSVIICAIGPLMNLAKAAEIDPITFSKVKKVVSMGGTLIEPGNVTPTAEFNVFADPVAASIIYSLTSPNPLSTLPKNNIPNSIINYINSSSFKPISLTIVPLDITHQHYLNEQVFYDRIKSNLTELSPSPSPLESWMSIWMKTTFDAMRSINDIGIPTLIHMHDPLAIWYAITYESLPNWKINQSLDIRVETTGEWTAGSLIFDRRGRSKSSKPIENDRGNWLLTTTGNRIDVCIESPASGEHFANQLLDFIFH